MIVYSITEAIQATLDKGEILDEIVSGRRLTASRDFPHVEMLMLNKALAKSKPESIQPDSVGRENR